MYLADSMRAWFRIRLRICHAAQQHPATRRQQQCATQTERGNTQPCPDTRNSVRAPVYVRAPVNAVIRPRLRKYAQRSHFDCHTQASCADGWFAPFQINDD